MFLWIYILITIVATRSQSGWGCAFPKKYGFDHVLDCGNTDITRLQLSPDVGLGKNYFDFVDLTGCKNLMLHKEDFQGWTNLKRMDLSYIPIEKQKGNIPLDIFQNLESLQVLNFTNSKLTDQEMWILPTNIFTYNVSRNLYQNLNLSNYMQLSEVDVSYNKMKNIPAFSHPVPVKELYMEGNPLDKLTYKDLVPLCKLKTLKLNVPPDSSLIGGSSSCQCKQIVRWLLTFNITCGRLTCGSLFFDFISKCDLTFADVKDLRGRCNDAHILPLEVPPDRNRLGIFILVFLFLLLLFIIPSMIYVTYRKLKQSPPIIDDGIQSEELSGSEEEIVKEQPTEE